MAGTLAMVLREFGKNRESGGEEEDDSDDRLRDGNKTIGEGNDDLWHDGDESSGMMRDESATAKSFVLLLSCSASGISYNLEGKTATDKTSTKMLDVRTDTNQLRSVNDVG
jgi:hypothetical protein